MKTKTVLEIITYSNPKTVRYTKTIALATGALVCIPLQGCFGPLGAFPSRHGTFVVQADKEGLRAAGDVLNGLVTNGKATPNHDTPHWTTRRLQETEQTKRDTFLDSLITQNEQETK